MNNIEIFNNICKIQESSAKDYFESKERFFLINILEKMKHDLNMDFNDDELLFLMSIFKKYKKYID